MTIEDINEAVQVIALFDTKRVRPLRFFWRDRAYHINFVNAAWDDKEGNDKVVYFSVSTKESSTFELIYNTGGFLWKIGRVVVDD